jgi:hypothetical protein
LRSNICNEEQANRPTRIRKKQDEIANSAIGNEIFDSGAFHKGPQIQKIEN